jgi:6-phosphofructokinase 1
MNSGSASTRKRVGVMTSGGDCPGLNAAIRAITRRAVNGHGFEVIGIEDAVAGLASRSVRPLTPHAIDDGGFDPLLVTGGTILGSINKPVDALAEVIEAGYKDLELDALIAIAGDGSLAILQQHARNAGWNLIGVPKTIDNDVGLTDRSIGFDSAVRTATRACAHLRTTGVSHDRVMVLETMGRGAGHLALHVGIAGGANAILIPELEWNMESLLAALENTRRERGELFALVVSPTGEVIESIDLKGRRRLIGVGDEVATAIEAATDGEVQARATVLGHIQRGGRPSPNDIILATQFGIFAADLVAEERFDHMVALHGTSIDAVPLSDVVAAGSVGVQPDDPLLYAGRSVGIYTGI